MKINNNQISDAYLQQTITLKGWVKKVRKLGNLVFVDIRDRYALVQIFAHHDDLVFKQLNELNREDVIYVTGELLVRKQKNPDLLTGNYELHAHHVEVLSKAKTPPLIIENETDANEDVRFAYRYLDLRRPKNLQTFQLRSKVAHIIRSFLHSLDFIETETPILGKPTPEGARDFLVPTRSHKFYALPQSPQIFKQLLMVAGFEKYFQITKCFRDEDLRSDRQPEFTQVDLEMSFVNEQDIQDLIEVLLKRVFAEALNYELKTPFLRMTYADAFHNYGTDKPDLRYELKIQDTNNLFAESSSKILQNIVSEGKVVRYLYTGELLTKKQVQDLEKYAKDKQAKGLIWMRIENGIVVDGSFAKLKEDHSLYLQLLDKHQLTSGTLLLVADNYEIATEALGIVRTQLASVLNLKNTQSYAFVWIVDWPLYEFDQDTNRYVAAHHPFTAPQQQCINDFDTNQKDALGRSYDIVLNGYELGGGSVRIINPDVQKRMFSSINLSAQEIEQKFGFLLEAFSYGVPPHAGIALGLDRLIMILINSEMIKDVVVFPKNNQGVDMMMHAPSFVSDEELVDLGVQNVKPKPEK
ncbi:aspartate--tRNA ligase [Ureaplasma miroungigenitalium]|uniref:aspartate--tRNA ligase n=1 Tax=Ureaplasma miroungigenitalium TaxID=1042321 RepID=UPI0021E7B8EE|nr:aspartate--tRNA ligase [Ureaplasma miroungigenitalium]MCV3734154.1 aspartate--tRNA ligase [Ureaplasma miroungigenitalium]